MSSSENDEHASAGWLIAIVAAIAVVSVIAVFYFFLNRPDGVPASGADSVTAEVQMTPIVGGTTVPLTVEAQTASTGDGGTDTAAGESAEAAASAEAASEIDADKETETTTDDGSPADTSMVAGALAIVAGPDSGGARLYSDASADAMVMAIYADGEEMTIVEPSGEHDGYPVTVEGAQWVRVRAADGLVGWVVAGNLVVVE